MFSCTLTSISTKNKIIEFSVTKDETFLNTENNIILADSSFGRKLYDMVNSGISIIEWKDAEYLISDVIRHKTYAEMIGYRSPEGKKVAEIIRNNKVKYLVHFTRMENLFSIIEHGILSIQTLDTMKLPYINNDFGRYDNRKDCSCFSVEFPNDLLLKSFQRRQSNCSWIIFLIDVFVLISSETEKQFCIHNAASKGISEKIKFNQLRTSEEFRKMFSERIAFNKRDGEHTIDRNINKSYLATSNQAEILIKGSVDRNYIKGIITQNQSDKIFVDSALREFDLEGLIDSVLEPRYFIKRNDVNFKER